MYGLPSDTLNHLMVVAWWGFHRTLVNQKEWIFLHAKNFGFAEGSLGSHIVHLPENKHDD